ncbi:MAG: recombination regulator RecX [Betaproteobacteria bacterium]
MSTNKPSLKARALRYLSAREHSRQELARKLMRHAQEGDDIDSVLDWLEAQKFLSESRFAESLTHRRAARFGNARVLSELHSHGLNEGLVAEVKAQLLSDEDERAWLIWQRKFGAVADNPVDVARQQRFLQQRGFSHTAIRAVMRRAAQRDDTDG